MKGDYSQGESEGVIVTKEKGRDDCNQGESEGVSVVKEKVKG